jgi:hypothetical protein
MNAYEHPADSHLRDLILACQRVPLLEAHAADEGRIVLILDGRLGLALSEAEACAVVPFIVDCMEAASAAASRGR